MAETSQPWDGTLGGDATRAPYSAQEWLDMYADMFRSYANKGVIQSILGELAVTGAVSPVSVAAGSSLVLGRWHRSTTAVLFAISTPGAGTTRTDRIVVRSDYVAYTVRLVRLTGAGGGAEPALTQTPGVRWEIPLAKVSIDDTGAITLTDEREYCAFHAGVTLDANADTILSLTAQVLGLDPQVANRVWAGPAAGLPAVPTFRAPVVADLPAHNLLSVQHGDTVADSVIRGDLLVGNVTPAWARLAKGAQYRVLMMGADDPAWTALAASHLPAHAHNAAGEGGDYAWADITGFAIPANTVKLAAVQGVATTVLRSDATLALDVSIAPTWTGAHIFANTLTQSGGYAYLGSYNTGAGVYPRAGNDLAIGWNFTNGERDVDFWNTDTTPAPTAFQFKQLTGAASATTLMALTGSGNMTVAGSIATTQNRPIQLGVSAGQVHIKGDAGGWAVSYAFRGSADTDKGGFGALGAADALTYYFIGPTYDTAYMVLKAGNIGIGTATPTSPLTVQANAGSLAIRIKGRADHYGFLEFFKNDGTTLEGAIYGITGRMTLTDAAGADVLSVTAGNVGIGTATPLGRLHVAGSVGGDVSVQIGDAALQAAGTLSMWNITRRGDDYFGAGTRGLTIWGDKNGSYVAPILLQADGDIILAGSNGGGVTNGNVGIGTVTPNGKLHVVTDWVNIDPSLTVHATAAWDLESAGVELVGGVAVNSPYPYWIQARGGGVAFSLSLNPLGGNVGIGLTAPQGRLHGLGAAGVGSFAHFDAAGIDNTGVIFIPNGAGDVTLGITILFVLASTFSAASVSGATRTVAPGTTLPLDFADGGGNIWSIRVNANGQMDIYRSTTGGTPATATVSIWAVWV